MKVAFSRLVVSLLSLVTVVVALATLVLKLLATMVGLLTVAFERAAEATRSRRGSVGVSKPPEASEPSGPFEAPNAPRANLRVLPSQSSKSAELTRALVGLGFQTPAVKRFVATLTEEDMKQDIRDLIKAGLKDLGRAA
jgi:hypothetical protein